MKQAIIDYIQDEDSNWRAKLECGHYQHVRHNPPWRNFPWITTIEGRASKLGKLLVCRECIKEQH